MPRGRMRNGRASGCQRRPNGSMPAGREQQQPSGGEAGSTAAGQTTVNEAPHRKAMSGTETPGVYTTCPETFGIGQQVSMDPTPVAAMSTVRPPSRPAPGSAEVGPGVSIPMICALPAGAGAPLKGAASSLDFAVPWKSGDTFRISGDRSLNDSGRVETRSLSPFIPSDLLNG